MMVKLKLITWFSHHSIFLTQFPKLITKTQNLSLSSQIPLSLKKSQNSCLVQKPNHITHLFKSTFAKVVDSTH